MPEIPLFLSISSMAVLHCAIGWLAAIAAKAKGYNFDRWIIWGLIGGTGALVVALMLKPKPFT